MAEDVEEYCSWTVDQLKFSEIAADSTDWKQGRACQKSC